MLHVKRAFPMKREDKERLFREINNIIKGLFKGLFLIAVIEGIIAWIGFYLFGIPNPIIWSLIIAIFAMIPVVGPILIWLPASVYLIINGHVTNGIVLFLYSAIIITYVDKLSEFPAFYINQWTKKPKIRTKGALFKALIVQITFE